MSKVSSKLAASVRKVKDHEMKTEATKPAKRESGSRVAEKSAKVAPANSSDRIWPD